MPAPVILQQLFRSVTKMVSWAGRKVGETFMSISQKLHQMGVKYDVIKQATDIRQSITEIDFYKKLYQDLKPTEKVPRERVIETKLKRAYKYRSLVDVKLRNTETNEEKSFMVSIYHNTNYSLNQLRQNYWDRFVKKSDSGNVEDISYYDYVITGFERANVWHDQGSRY